MAIESIRLQDVDRPGSEFIDVPVPRKFKRKYDSAKKKLQLATSETAPNRRRIKKATDAMEKLNEQLVDYAKDFKERPIKHKADIKGLLDKNGKANRKTYFLKPAGIILASLVAATAVLAVMGYGAPAVLPAAVVIGGGIIASKVLSKVENKSNKRVDILREKIEKEESMFQSKQSNSKQQQNTNAIPTAVAEVIEVAMVQQQKNNDISPPTAVVMGEASVQQQNSIVIPPPPLPKQKRKTKSKQQSNSEQQQNSIVIPPPPPLPKKKRKTKSEQQSNTGIPSKVPKSKSSGRKIEYKNFTQANVSKERSAAKKPASKEQKNTRTPENRKPKQQRKSI